ncbi:hypothetical protein BBJ28_00008009 [Nothophytophthora sp. Chile5]|nr:hypothetical protein BBJ28_00008009 [Nothophytophthora sp. Chile5]
MSLWCFCLSRRRSDQARTRMLFQEQFERIKGVYPGTSYMCLLDGESGGMMCVTMPGVDLELFDCFEADKGIEPITAELRRIVDANQVNLRRNRS